MRDFKDDTALECPRCCKRKTVVPGFGWKTVKLKTGKAIRKPQSYCRACRAEKIPKEQNNG